MSTAPAAVAAPAARRLSRPALLAAAALALLFVVIVGGLAGGQLAGGFEPSPIALADIPADYLIAYQREAARHGIDWAMLAAIGKIECDHGRSRASGCNPPGTVNGAGATGPMQFLGSTWRRGTPPMSVPAAGPPTATTAEGYAADGDGDGIAHVWNAADAIAGAARLLRANGAPADYTRAVFVYNHAEWYVREVFELANSYRGAAPPSRRSRSETRPPPWPLSSATHASSSPGFSGSTWRANSSTRASSLSSCGRASGTPWS
jgi:hypothetical protein